MKIPEAGKWPGGVGADIAKKKYAIVWYELDGTKSGMRQQLSFLENKLASATVLKKDGAGNFTVVDEAVVADEAERKK